MCVQQISCAELILRTKWWVAIVHVLLVCIQHLLNSRSHSSCLVGFLSKNSERMWNMCQVKIYRVLFKSLSSLSLSIYLIMLQWFGFGSKYRFGEAHPLIRRDLRNKIFANRPIRTVLWNFNFIIIDSFACRISRGKMTSHKMQNFKQ